MAFSTPESSPACCVGGECSVSRGKVKSLFRRWRMVVAVETIFLIIRRTRRSAVNTQGEIRMAILEWQGLKKLGRRPQTEMREIGTGPGVKCEKCGEMMMRVDFESNLNVCTYCDHHHIIGAVDRIRVTLDYNSFAALDDDLAAIDILQFNGLESYTQKLAKARRDTGITDAMVSGTGKLKTRPVAFGVTDARFMAGSMGSVVGERLVRLVEKAVRISRHRREKRYSSYLPRVKRKGEGGSPPSPEWMRGYL